MYKLDILFGYLHQKNVINAQKLLERDYKKWGYVIPFTFVEEIASQAMKRVISSGKWACWIDQSKEPQVGEQGIIHEVSIPLSFAKTAPPLRFDWPCLAVAEENPQNWNQVFISKCGLPYIEICSLCGEKNFDFEFSGKGRDETFSPEHAFKGFESKRDQCISYTRGREEEYFLGLRRVLFQLNGGAFEKKGDRNFFGEIDEIPPQVDWKNAEELKAWLYNFLEYEPSCFLLNRRFVADRLQEILDTHYPDPLKAETWLGRVLAEFILPMIIKWLKEGGTTENCVAAFKYYPRNKEPISEFLDGIKLLDEKSEELLRLINEANLDEKGKNIMMALVYTINDFNAKELNAAPGKGQILKEMISEFVIPVVKASQEGLNPWELVTTMVHYLNDVKGVGDWHYFRTYVLTSPITNQAEIDTLQQKMQKKLLKTG